LPARKSNPLSPRTGARRLVRLVLGQRDLVLPQHAAGEIGQDRAGLHAGDPGADRVGEPARRPVAGEPADQRDDHLLEALDVDRGPVLAVDHAHRRHLDLRIQAGVRGDVPGRLLGERP